LVVRTCQCAPSATCNPTKDFYRITFFHQTILQVKILSTEFLVTSRLRPDVQVESSQNNNYDTFEISSCYLCHFGYKFERFKFWHFLDKIYFKNYKLFEVELLTYTVILLKTVLRFCRQFWIKSKATQPKIFTESHFFTKRFCKSKFFQRNFWFPVV
jgi:hypothetical protein